MSLRFAISSLLATSLVMSACDKKNPSDEGVVAADAEEDASEPAQCVVTEVTEQVGLLMIRDVAETCRVFVPTPVAEGSFDLGQSPNAETGTIAAERVDDEGARHYGTAGTVELELSGRHLTGTIHGRDGNEPHVGRIQIRIDAQLP